MATLDSSDRNGRLMNNECRPNSDVIFYQAEDGRTRIECRFENETVWLTQKLMAMTLSDAVVKPISWAVN
jgi:hypothetical protein